jgi:hypothetical protein
LTDCPAADVCGAFAGNAQVYSSSGCSGQCQSVVGTASNYNDAYWEIKSIKTFNVDGSTSASASPTATGTGANGSPSAQGGKSAAGRSWSLSAFAIAVVGVAVSVIA